MPKNNESGYRYSLEERETTIVYNDKDKTVFIWTCSPVTMRKLDKMCELYPDDYRCTGDSGGSKRYETHKKRIRFGKPAKKTPAPDEGG